LLLRATSLPDDASCDALGDNCFLRDKLLSFEAASPALFADLGNG
jgi:hypothetical protein